MYQKVKHISMLPTLLCCGLLGWSSVAWGAFGTLEAAPSGGTVPVSMTVSPLISIEDPGTLDWGDINSTPAPVQTISSRDFCVFSNTGSYQVKVYSAQTGSTSTSFGLVNGDNTIEYSVEWQVVGARAPAVNISNDSTTFSGPLLSGSDVVCSGGGLPVSLKANITLSIVDTAFDGVSSGSYSDTLTIEVQPV